MYYNPYAAAWGCMRRLLFLMDAFDEAVDMCNLCPGDFESLCRLCIIPRSEFDGTASLIQEVA